MVNVDKNSLNTCGHSPGYRDFKVIGNQTNCLEKEVNTFSAAQHDCVLRTAWRVEVMKPNILRLVQAAGL